MGPFRGQFWRHFSLRFCVEFLGRQKVTRAAPRATRSRQEPPRAAESEPARPLENIFQERRIVKVFCISNTPLVPVGTVADLEAKEWMSGAGANRNGAKLEGRG